MKRRVVLPAVALFLALVIWVAPWPLVRYGSSFLFLWILPGLAWASLLSPDALDDVERVAVGLGLNFVVTPVTTLLVAYMPGPLERGALVATVLSITLLPLLLSALWAAPAKASGKRPLGRVGWLWLTVAVLIAGGLRLVNLDYSEFQGDEAKVVVRASYVLEGDDEFIFQHKKGPSQMTAVMSGWRLTGMTNEWMARLPFAWAGILGVAGVFLLGRQLGRPHAGGIAACLLAIEGYLVGFGRIVQYQSLVFVLSAMGLLCLLAYYDRGRGGLLVVAAALFAGGALAHYDAALALPAGLLLVVARLWGQRRQIRRVLVPVMLAGLVGAGLVGAFYLPFLNSPYVEYTSSYISSRVGEGPYNHLPHTFELTAVYDSVYLLGLMALALAARTAMVWARWGRVGLMLSIAFIGAAFSGLLRPELWVVGGATLAWLPPIVLLIGAALAPGQPIGQRAVWLWLGVAASFYLFFVAMPFTHVHTAFPAWAVLSGVAVADLGRRLATRSGIALRGAAAVGVGLYALCGFYTAQMFVDHTPEYQRTFPRFRHPLYWTPYERMPEEGLFGFPYRAGWKVVGYLMDQGQLAGAYDSNEEHIITNYYARRSLRLDCSSPDMYVVAENVRDEVAIHWDQIEEESYRPAAVVTVEGEPKLTVYERGAAGDPQVYRAEEYAWAFDLNSTPGRVATAGRGTTDVGELEDHVPRGDTIGGFVRLVGYKVDTARAVPGGYVELILIWEALNSTLVDYHVFTHLYDGEMMWGQLDGQPVCGNLPTSEWEPGQLVVDAYRIPIREDVAEGTVPLTVGMYDFVTMGRLPVSAPDGTAAGDKVYLTDVDIGAP